MTKLIIKGDDLGWTDGINAGIAKCAADGILTETGCMPNMPAAARGIALLQQYPHIAIGQHTSIVNGRPCSDPAKIPHMVDDGGFFHSSRYYRSRMKDVTSAEIDVLPYYEEAVTEIRAQLKHFEELSGTKPVYLEGHSIPSRTFERALHDVAKAEDLIYIEPVKGGEDPVYHIWQPATIGHLAMDIFRNPDPYAQFTADVAEEILSGEFSVLEHEIVRLLFHPGFVDADLMAQSGFSGIRMRDCAALCDPRVKAWICANGIELTNVRELCGKGEG